MGAKMSASSAEIDIRDLLKYEFHGPLKDEDETNGLCFKNVYLPEEVVTLILSFISPEHILKTTLVCKKWCNIIKSTLFWTDIYKRKVGKQPEKLPWYVFYCYFATDLLDRNLLKNGNGQKGFKHWEIIADGGSGFTVEKDPCGADPLPPNIPEFNGCTSCFATSYDNCIKRQEIKLSKSKLLLYIVNKHKPSIYLSEWVCGRFDCGCVYILTCALMYKNVVMYDKSTPDFRVAQWEGKEWSKVRFICKQ